MLFLFISLHISFILKDFIAGITISNKATIFQPTYLFSVLKTLVFKLIFKEPATIFALIFFSANYKTITSGVIGINEIWGRHF